MASKKIAYYPAGLHENDKNGRDGLEHPLKLYELSRGLVPDEFYRELASHYGGSEIPFRAIRPSHFSIWSTLRQGDLAMFYREGVYYAKAQIAFKGQFENLARSIFPLERKRRNLELDHLFCFFEPTWTTENIRSDSVLRRFTIKDVV